MLSFELEYDKDCQRCRRSVRWILDQVRPIVRLVGKPGRGSPREGGGRCHLPPTLRSNDGRVWRGEAALRVALWSVPRGRADARSRILSRVRLKRLGVLPLPHGPHETAGSCSEPRSGWGLCSLLGFVVLFAASVQEIARFRGPDGGSLGTLLLAGAIWIALAAALVSVHRRGGPGAWGWTGTGLWALLALVGLFALLWTSLGLMPLVPPLIGLLLLTGLLARPGSAPRHAGTG